MRRLVTILSLFVIVAAACGDDAATSTTTTAVPTSSTTAATTTSTASTAATTTTLATTTTAGPTTTAASTTTTTLAPVTNLLGLPTGVLSRSQVPWDDVDEGWVVVRYNGTDANFTRDGPFILYLVDPAGPVYEIRSFEATDALIPGEISDFDFPLGALTNSGTHVYLQMNGPGGARIVSLSLESGLFQTTLELDPGNSADIGSTLPTGINVVVSHHDAATGEVDLDLLFRDGSSFATITQNTNFEPLYTWLYGLDGQTITVGEGPTGLHVFSNQGAFQRSLDAPPGICRPVRWWDQDTILAACIPAATLAISDYEVLYLVPFDGSPHSQLTATPPPGFDTDDPGHQNAWQADGRVLLQAHGDLCTDGSWIEELGPGMTTTPVAMAPELDSPSIVAQDGDDLIVWNLSANCLEGTGSLHVIAADGGSVRTLIPEATPVFGVVGVAAMIPTP